MSTATDPSILVVDDFLDGREMVAEYLRFKGFSVLEAAGGAEAIELAREHNPRVILMDLGMHGVDGWEATRQLKAAPATTDIVIIALTAHAMKREITEAIKAGCDRVIPKPFDLRMLPELLHDILRTALDSAPPATPHFAAS
jgi:CheY-like chemotaxis protein